MFQFLIDSSPNVAPTVESSGSFSYAWIVAAIVLLTVAVIALARLVRMLRRPSLEGLTREKILETWKQIEHTSDQGLMGAKLAVIEADKLLDAILKSMFIPGETLGERLKVAGYKYPELKKVWTAHKLRNQLVHDSSFQITIRQAKSALHDFEKAYKTLNVL